MDNEVCNINSIPEVTVLIIVYNQGQYIKQTIDSILSQKTDFSFEIVVADDCSTDCTRQICELYQNNYPYLINYVRREKNLGLIGNLFTAFFNECRGRYIATCAGDDYWIDEYKLQKQYVILNSRPDISVVLTGYRKFFEESGTFLDINKWESPLLRTKGKKMIKSVLYENFSFFPVVSSILFRNKETIQMLKKCKSLYSGERVPGEAMILLSIFALNGKYAFLEDLTTVYRIRKGSLSHTDSIKHKIDFAIRYSIQKMDVAEYFNLAATVKYKLVIKFVFQYLYIYQDGFSSEFIEILNKYSNEKRSVCLKRAITTILLLSKSKVLRDLFLIILNLKNR